jgi:threonyl-tRNA synthetase
MKLLMWHCSTLSSKDIRKSNRPQGIRELTGDPTKVTFSDVLVAFICVERDDSEATVGKACEEILRQSENIGRRNLVVVPFAHLSNKLMTDSEEAQSVIAALSTRLEGSGLDVTTNSFGYHKQFELHYVAKGYPGSVAFRDVNGSED